MVGPRVDSSALSMLGRVRKNHPQTNNTAIKLHTPKVAVHLRTKPTSDGNVVDVVFSFLGILLYLILLLA
jgi:hypothetical protein